MVETRISWVVEGLTGNKNGDRIKEKGGNKMIQCIEKQQSKMARLLVLMRQILKAVDETSLNGFGVDHNGFITVQNDKPLHVLGSFPEFENVEHSDGIYTYTLEVK